MKRVLICKNDQHIQSKGLDQFQKEERVESQMSSPLFSFQSLRTQMFQLEKTHQNLKSNLLSTIEVAQQFSKRNRLGL